MGRSMPVFCAAEGCTVLRNSVDEKHGVTFDVQKMFARDLKTSNAQVWCCCPAHKQEAIAAVLKGLPYRSNIKNWSEPFE